MKTLIRFGLRAGLLVTLLYALPVISAPVPHTFSNGQPADATQVNENFQDLVTRIESVSAGTKGDKGDKGDPGVGVVEINFDPYRHNFSSKTFRRNGPNEAGQSGWFWQEVRTYDRSVPGTVIETREVINGVGGTYWFAKLYSTTGPGQNKIRTKREIYDPSDKITITGIDEYDPGLTIINNTMIIGHPWSTHSINNWSDPLAMPVELQTGISGSVETRVLIGQESTTANNETYDNCLKILRFNQGNETLLWYCEGMGLVKFVNNGSIRELVSTTP